MSQSVQLTAEADLEGLVRATLVEAGAKAAARVTKSALIIDSSDEPRMNADRRTSSQRTLQHYE